MVPFSESESFAALFLMVKERLKVRTGINSSFMVLVPKVTGSDNIKDYKPISLVNGVFKLLLKTLSLILAPLFSQVVSDCLYAFLKGWSTLEYSMIANKLVHLAIRRKKKFMVLKLDFHKEFDIIDWNYLLSILLCINFPVKWIEVKQEAVGVNEAFTKVSANLHGSTAVSYGLGVPDFTVREGDRAFSYAGLVPIEREGNGIARAGHRAGPKAVGHTNTENRVRAERFARFESVKQ
ncbi:uncharacterized protein LOC126681465 [Mercurialis annua]|uniref:uncharacterized protein LOC126681465 n=1 Tax=Mercurialis annua TaxID=3986 RepID=UPI00215E7376|nr:uncharacterized protein LOC126681465 [Mercurialis annua]